MHDPTLLAGIDLGSNSYRLEIARVVHGQLQRTEYLKETVRQGNGLDANRNLTPEAMQRGWDCLARFAERLADFKPRQVRAVATQTLREANNRDEFLARAQTILGFHIDVISGVEEARLIYQGVTHQLPQAEERRMVVDIGGRSTELVTGVGLQPEAMASYRVGSVSWSMRYFADGVLRKASFEAATIAAMAVLDEAAALYHTDKRAVVYGSSGTVGAVSDVLIASGWPTGVITRAGLDWLYDKLLRAQTVDKLRIDGMKDDRRQVIGGGLSVLRAVFNLLEIDQMQVAEGTLRHGVLYDLIERQSDATDIRAATVERMAHLYGVDRAQTERVGKVAVRLFEQLSPGGDASARQAHSRQARKLDWAAKLHEIGCCIAHSDYHRHGAYILDHADAPGFSLPELHRLGLLVLGHRGKLRKLEADLGDTVLVEQLLCLRLAVLLCHARRDPQLTGLRLSRHSAGYYHLVCPESWAASYPQSAHLLREEVVAWQKTPIVFRVQGV